MHNGALKIEGNAYKRWDCRGEANM